MYKLVLNNKIIGEYRTRLEAEYYKKQHPKSKVVTEYSICDLNAGVFEPETVIMAESPLKALQQYIKQNNLNIRVKCDSTGRDIRCRFVVRGNHTSKVYKVID